MLVDDDGTGRIEGPLPTLRIIETTVFRGPSHWQEEPAIQLLVDLGVLEQFPSNLIPGFVDNLLQILPTVGDHACSHGRTGGFRERLRDGTWAGHIAEHIALDLQDHAGTPVLFGKTRSTGQYGRYHCVYEYRDEPVGLLAGRMAVGIVNHLVAPDDRAHSFEFPAELERLRRLADGATGRSSRRLGKT